MADNIAMFREITEALNTGDRETLDRYIADDVVWHTIGGSEPIRGKAALRETMSPGTRDFTIEVTTHDVLASDDHVVALVNAVATRGDRKLEYRTAEIAHVRDGQIIERWAFSDDTARITEFFA